MKKTFADILVVLLIRASSFLFLYPTAIIMSRGLGSENYGKYGVFVACFTFYSTILVFGYDQLLVRKISNYYSSLKFVNILKFILGYKFVVLYCLLSAAFFLLKVEIGSYLPGSATLLLLCGVVLAYRKLQSGFIRSGKHPIHTQIAENIIQPAIFLALISYLIFTGNLGLENSLFCVFTALFISMIYQAIMGYILDKNKRVVKNESRVDELTIKLALPFWGIALSNELLVFADRFIISALIGYSETGVFMVAIRNASLLLIVVTAFQLVLNPYFSQSFEEGKYSKLRKIAATQTLSQFLLATACTILLIVVALNITLIFGNEFSDAKSPLIIISLLFLCSFIFGSGLQYMFMTDNSKTAFAIGIFTIAIYITMLLVFTPIWGIEGAAIATGLAEVLKRAIAAFCFYNSNNIKIDVFSSLKYLAIRKRPLLNNS